MVKRSETLKDQARVAASRFAESKKTWDAADRRFIRNVDVYLWRNRFKLMSSAARAFMSIQNVPDDLGPTIERWQNMNSKAGTAIRAIGDYTITTRRSFTVSELEVALPKNFSCSRKSLQAIVNRGVELGLLVRGCNSSFDITELFCEEFFSRVLWRDLNPDIVEWCRQVTMIDEMVQTAIETTEQETRGSLYDSGMRSISERIDMGDYDDEIGYKRK
jgi:hypothetical protein